MLYFAFIWHICPFGFDGIFHAIGHILQHCFRSSCAITFRHGACAPKTLHSCPSHRCSRSRARTPSPPAESLSVFCCRRVCGSTGGPLFVDFAADFAAAFAPSVLRLGVVVDCCFTTTTKTVSKTKKESKKESPRCHEQTHSYAGVRVGTRNRFQ